MSIRRPFVALLMLTLVAAFGAAAMAADRISATLKSSVDRNYRRTYQFYWRDYSEDKKQIRDFYINRVMASAVADGRVIPNGAIIVMEVSGAELGPDGQVLRDMNGKMILGSLNVISVMENINGVGALVSKDQANGDWAYFFFSDNFDDKTTSADRADCLKCHKNAEGSAFVFTYDAIRKAVR